MNKSYINKIIKTWRTIKMAKLRTLIRNWDESAESIIIPNTYSRIGKDAFNYNLNLKNVVLPDSIVLIGDCAFFMCFELQHINIPKSVKTIGHYAFMNCDNLERITLSENIKRIGWSVFSGCDNLIIECKRDSYAYRYCKQYPRLNVKVIE